LLVVLLCVFLATAVVDAKKKKHKPVDDSHDAVARAFESFVTAHSKYFTPSLSLFVFCYYSILTSNQ